MSPVHPLRAFAVSTAVGSGKTKAAVHYVATPGLRQQNFLYVAPTKRLIGQTCDNLRAAIQESGSTREVALIHSESQHSDGLPVAIETLQAINDALADAGQVVIITTTTFLNIVSRIERPEDWRVILDEAFSPVEFSDFQLGRRLQDAWNLFRAVFEIDPDQNFRLVPKAGQTSWVKEIASGDPRRVGDVFRPFQPLARLVTNPAYRCELVMTDKAKALVEQAFDLVIDETVVSNDAEAESKLLFASYVTPDAFVGFAEVIFMSALFEHTMLYKLWTTIFKVAFAEHPAFPAGSLRDVHTEQGKFVSVGHLLHEDDRSSLYNLTRNVHTAAVGESEEGERVIDRVVELCAARFVGSPFLLQTNGRFGYHVGSRWMPSNAVPIPASSHGLNEFQQHRNVAALAVTNPVRQQAEWIMSRTGLTMEEATAAYRIHTTYQAVGRSAIRAEASTDSPKVFLTVGREDAWLLHQLFKGSTWLGQVGDMKSMAATAAASRPARLEVEVAAKIEAHLEALPTTTKRVSSRGLKALLGPDCTGTTWTRAMGRIAWGYNGWASEGQSFVRMDAEYMGFTVQDGYDAEAEEAV